MIRALSIILLSATCSIAEPDVCFTPGQDCEQKIIAEIDTAKTSVLLQAYTFNSIPIASALCRAQSRGAKVNCILDRNVSQNGPMRTTLHNCQIPILIDSAHNIAHNKVIIIDAQTVITGSYNFTWSADHRNAENVIIFEQRPDLAAQFTNNFQQHAAHSHAWTN
ncbi:MAG: phospholipase D family protein [Candidatus Udaeobacter sp.]